MSSADLRLARERTKEIILFHRTLQLQTLKPGIYFARIKIQHAEAFPQ